MAPPWEAIALGVGALGSLFQRDPAKANLKAQQELLRMQYQREDLMRPYKNAMFDPRQNPAMAQQLQLSQGNNLFNWGAMANRMTPQMLALLETAAPQYSAARNLLPSGGGQQPPANSYPYGGGPYGGGMRPNPVQQQMAQFAPGSGANWSAMARPGMFSR